MSAERFAQSEFDVRVLAPKLVASGAQVFADMEACGQEIRNQQDTLGALGNATLTGLLDGRLGELKEGGLNAGVSPALG